MFVPYSHALKKGVAIFYYGKCVAPKAPRIYMTHVSIPKVFI